MTFRSGERGNEGGIALHFTPTAVSGAVALASSSTLGCTLEAYDQNTMAHKVFVARGNLD